MFSARYHSIYHSVILQIFCCLEIIRQFLANSLFNNTATCKPNDGTWFSNLNVTKHRKRRSNTASCRMSQQNNIRQACFC